MAMCTCNVVLLAVAMMVYIPTSFTARSAVRLLSERVNRLEDSTRELLELFATMNSSRSAVQDIQPCPDEFYMHRPTLSCYRIMKEVKTWYKAREMCHSQGADLIWYENPVEYRHVVIKLLTSLTETKDYQNSGYWSGANDITGGSLVWGDTGLPVMSSFLSNSQSSSNSYRYGRQSSSSTENAQKHCVFMKYQRSTMRMTQELSECDGERLYICKCKTKGKGACVPPSELDRKTVVKDKDKD